MHRALASVADDEVLRAQHLALASPGTDLELASTVAEAVATASARGAVYEAEQLAAQALRLTPPEAAEYPERLLMVARCHLAANDMAATSELLVSRVHELPHPRNNRAQSEPGCPSRILPTPVIWQPRCRCCPPLGRAPGQPWRDR